METLAIDKKALVSSKRGTAGIERKGAGVRDIRDQGKGPKIIIREISVNRSSK